MLKVARLRDVAGKRRHLELDELYEKVAALRVGECVLVPLRATKNESRKLGCAIRMGLRYRGVNASILMANDGRHWAVTRKD